MPDPLLSLKGVTKRYGPSLVLNGAALELRAGEIHALMGENGAGKSTLIKILAGVTEPDSAQASLRGEPLSLHAGEAFRHGFRFIHQELDVVPQLSVAENVFIAEPYPRRAGMFVDWRKLNAAARSALAELEVTHIAPSTRMARLGTGDRMLVKLASALLPSTGAPGSVYVLDEPTAALTGAEAERLFRVLRRLARTGCAVLYVSHRLDEVFEICDRVTVMRDGRTLATLKVPDTTPGDVIRLMTGREVTQTYPPRVNKVGTETVLAVRGLESGLVQGVNFSLRAGEILGVAGLAGSGRSELLHALVGAATVTGEVILAGQRLKPDVARSWARGVALVPEERRAQGLVLSRSVRDNVTLPYLGAVSRGGVFLNRSKEKRLTRSLGESVRLKATGPQQTVRQLSGGNQQKVLFARAMAGAPRALLLDEPTRGVDVGAKYDIYTLVRGLSADGVGIVLVSSDLGEVVSLCDRVLVLVGGRQAALISAAGLTQDALLSLCYGERDSSTPA